MRIAPPVLLSASQQDTLKQWAGSRSLPARQVERAKVVLLAAAGRTDLEMATTLRITNQKAARWRKRFLSLGLAGLTKDAARPGRKPAIAARVKAEVVRKTTHPNHPTPPIGAPGQWPPRWESVRLRYAGSGTPMG